MSLLPSPEELRGRILVKHKAAAAKPDSTFEAEAGQPATFKGTIKVQMGPGQVWRPTLAIVRENRLTLHFLSEDGQDEEEEGGRARHLPWYIPRLTESQVNRHGHSKMRAGWLNIISCFARVLSRSGCAGAYLLRDTEGSTEEDVGRHVLSFLSSEGDVCHVYLDDDQGQIVLGNELTMISSEVLI